MYQFRKIQLPILVTSVLSVFWGVNTIAQTEVEKVKKKGFAIEKIIVTARKREESLQDAPLSVSAFTQSDLELRNITASNQLGEVTPNLSFDANAPVSGSSASSQIFIRGIGQTDFTAVTDPGVGLYIDGVYLARSMGGAMAFLDLEQVEVVKGPQGTLFGRNTIGGAISLTTARPRRYFAGQVKAQVGNDNMRNLVASVDIPISDTLFSKISVASADRDGYVIRVNDGIDLGDDNTLNARVKLLWEPSEDFTMDFIADYTKEEENGSPSVSRGLNEQSTFPYLNNAFLNSACSVPAVFAPSGPGRETNGDPNCLNYSRDLGPFKSGGTGKVASDFENYGFTLIADWAISESVNLKSITGYRDIDSYSARDADNTEQTVFHTEDIFTQDQFSQELQFSGESADDSLKWIVGLFYFEESADNPNEIIINPGVQGTFLSGGQVENESYAVFSQVTYSATERLDLTLGLRYSDETKSFIPYSYTREGEVYVSQNGTIGIGDTTLPHGPNRLVPDVWVEQSFDDVTAMYSASYDIAESVMGYASYSEGFKSGGFDQRFGAILEDVSEFSPETANAYEIGLKTSLLDNSLRLNMSAFSTDYEDLQLVVRRGFAPVTLNAGKAEIAGFEAEATFVPNEFWLVQFSMGYIDAEYVDLSNVLDEPDILATVSLDSKLAKTPEFTGSLGIAYYLDSDWGLITPRIDINYSDSYFNDAPNSFYVAQDEFTLVHASIAFTTNNDKWDLVLSARNITDERYITGGVDVTKGGPGYTEANYARPREWSFSVRYNFE